MQRPKEWHSQRPTCNGLPQRRQQWCRSERKAGSGTRTEAARASRRGCWRNARSCGPGSATKGGMAGIAALRRRCWSRPGQDGTREAQVGSGRRCETTRHGAWGPPLSRTLDERQAVGRGHGKRGVCGAVAAGQRPDGTKTRVQRLRRKDVAHTQTAPPHSGSYTIAIKRVRCPGKIKPPLGCARPRMLARNSQGAGHGGE
jgi:hypothetical protein